MMSPRVISTPCQARIVRLRLVVDCSRQPTPPATQGGDKFIVLASDGVWEFISSQEAIDIVNSSLDEGTMKV